MIMIDHIGARARQTIASSPLASSLHCRLQGGMKRLTSRLKRHLIHRAARESKKLRDRSLRVVNARRSEARQHFMAIRAALPPARLDYDCRPGYCTIVPPSKFSLAENYDATLAFILDMRSMFHARQVRSPNGKRLLSVFADFASIHEIEPAAGLVLAAEVDRWRLATGKQPISFDGDWQPGVQRFFSQAGLFELLGISQAAPLENVAADRSVEVLQFVRGFSVYGEQGSRLRDRLEALCGKSIGPRLKVYEAIAEAIANTRHAYPSGVSIWPSKLSGRWWASGAWNRSTNVVSIQLYDQGVGIPATLPRSEHWSDILRRVKLAKLLNPEGRDDQLLEAALEIGRTSTGEHGRGKGLAEIAGWIDNRLSGFLRITSGRGSITYRPGGAIAGGSRSASFPGTLVEWEVALDD